MDKWGEIQLFLHAVETNSLTAAAKALGMSKPAATRHLASLERRLGVRLMERNTRRLHVTDVGQQFFERCRQIHSDLREAEGAAQSTVLQPSGQLTLGCSLSFATLHIAPILPDYHRLYPEVTINLVVANRYMDMIETGIDLAVRTREYEPDSSITVRRLAQTRRILTAAPSYLRQHSVPLDVDDLRHHKLLQYSLSNHPEALHFTQGGIPRTIKIKPLLQSNDGQVLRAAAIEGHGILIQPKYIIYDDIVAGRLVPVLDDCSLPVLTINIAYPSKRLMPAKVRTFIDFLVERFAQMQYEEKWMS